MYTTKKLILLVILLISFLSVRAAHRFNRKDPENQFTMAVKEILNSSRNNFEDIKGLYDSADHFYVYYAPEVSIPDTKVCTVRKSQFGATYFCEEGNYSGFGKAKRHFRVFLNEMKQSLPDYYFERDTSVKEYFEYLFGKLTSDGYDRESGSIRMVSAGKRWHIYVLFEKGLRQHFTFCNGNADSKDSMHLMLSQFIQDCETDFNKTNVTPYQEGPDTKYLTGKGIPGTLQNELVKYGDRFHFESLIGVYSDSAYAKQVYREWFKKINNSLPSDYVWFNNTGQPGVYLNTGFTRKKNRAFDYSPVVNLTLEKSGSKYDLKINISRLFI